MTVTFSECLNNNLVLNRKSENVAARAEEVSHSLGTNLRLKSKERKMSTKGLRDGASPTPVKLARA
jgi:hypothetical protein